MWDTQLVEITVGYLVAKRVASKAVQLGGKRAERSVESTVGRSAPQMVDYLGEMTVVDLVEKLEQCLAEMMVGKRADM